MSLPYLHPISQFVVISAEEAHANEPSEVALVLTTIFCFLLVYWVLKKFAFGPILSVIDERRDKVENDLAEAEKHRKEADAKQAQLEERLQNIENEAREKMQELIAEGKRAASSIQENARNEADAMIEKAQKNIRLETEKARAELKEEIVTLTIKATESLIKEELDDGKHRELIGDFITRLERN